MKETTMTKTALDINNLSNVLSVYSGRDGRCCCGCAGKHYYSSENQKAASKDRGYKVDDDEVNDKMVRKVVKILNNTDIMDRDCGNNHISTVVNGRLYVVYFKKAVR
jgi:hypothetical protein